METRQAGTKNVPSMNSCWVGNAGNSATLELWRPREEIEECMLVSRMVVYPLTGEKLAALLPQYKKIGNG